MRLQPPMTVKTDIQSASLNYTETTNVDTLAVSTPLAATAVNNVDVPNESQTSPGKFISLLGNKFLGN